MIEDAVIKITWIFPSALCPVPRLFLRIFCSCCQFSIWVGIFACQSTGCSFCLFL